MRWQVLGIALFTSACSATVPHSLPPPPPTPPPVVQPPPPPVVQQQSPPYDGHVKHIGSWITNPDNTSAYTDTVMLFIDCGDVPGSLAAARSRANQDNRSIILHSGLMGWGNNGYQLEDGAANCWVQGAWQFISEFRSRVIAVHTVDEPWDTAWSYWQNGVYTPNMYNADITKICAIVHGDFPDLHCAVNVGSVPDALQIPDGIDEVWVESYGTDWLTKLGKVSGKTAAPLVLMPPGFITGDPGKQDPIAAGIIKAEWEEAKQNPRIIGFVWFLYCCDDTTTGTKDFYTVSGGRLPQTLQALTDLGRLMVSH